MLFIRQCIGDASTSTQPANNKLPTFNCRCEQAACKPVAMISEIKQIEASVPIGVTNHEANHVEVSRIDHLIRKGISQKIGGTAQLGK